MFIIGYVSSGHFLDFFGGVVEGEIVEKSPPDEFFEHPKSDRTELFLSQMTSH